MEEKKFETKTSTRRNFLKQTISNEKINFETFKKEELGKQSSIDFCAFQSSCLEKLAY